MEQVIRVHVCVDLADLIDESFHHRLLSTTDWPQRGVLQIPVLKPELRTQFQLALLWSKAPDRSLKRRDRNCYALQNLRRTTFNGDAILGVSAEPGSHRQSRRPCFAFHFLPE